MIPLSRLPVCREDLARRPHLDGVSLDVPRGSVYGLVVENGAGKSTLIKHLLGLWRAETGLVRVFGRDPVADPVSVLSRVGTFLNNPTCRNE
jgi:ABC-2 type transport system ATP-binding protein